MDVIRVRGHVGEGSEAVGVEIRIANFGEVELNRAEQNHHHQAPQRYVMKRYFLIPRHTLQNQAFVDILSKARVLR